ncbi:MAG: hypothetical protein IJH00_00090 [Erysipelotrichaceae bacterium]|nr:hypothetical protein [Erysipelotrichaceae bacterium]
MHYLYYCNSAYQLINVLNLHWHRKNAGFEDINNYSADLIIMKAFYGAERVAEIVENESTFERVYVLDKAEDNSGVFHLLKSSSDIIFKKQYLKNKYDLNAEELKYDVMTVPKFSRIVAAIWQLNKNCELQLYEDGLATYFFDLDLIVPRSRSYKLLYKRFNYGRDFLDYSGVYLIAPELFIGEIKDKIRKLPKFDNRYLEQLRTEFKEFSGYEDELKKNLLWFSQSMYDEHEVLDVLKKYKEDVLYCPHPRYPSSSDDFMVSRNKQIWEMKALNMKNINDTCLISINSTALFNPKLLFDEEPYLIFVYKLVKLFYDYSLFEGTIKLFKEEYSDPDKVMIPETLEELDECIKMYMKKVDEK